MSPTVLAALLAFALPNPLFPLGSLPPTLEALLCPPDAPLGQAPPEAILLGRQLRSAPDLVDPKTLAALDRLQELGHKAAPVLVDLLATGSVQIRQAAAVLLGTPVHPPGTLAPLCRALADPSPSVALAAALALRDRNDPLTAPRLLLAIRPEAVRGSPLLATTAATALLELGSPAGVPLLLAVLQAGIPGSEALETRHGLPAKETWALEKEIALRALRRLSQKHFGFEPEQGWADQLQGVKRWTEWWATHGPAALSPQTKAYSRALADAAARVRTALPALPPNETARALDWLRNSL